MARPKRIDLPFSLFHVFSRTNSGDAAFMDRRDRGKFLYYLSEFADIYQFRIHAFCLMKNHFHLLLESGEGPALSALMHRLLTAYTVYFNRRHDRHGHLFQGRYKSLIIDKASYLLAVSRYIHLNPKESYGRVKPETYEGSSLHYYINGGEPDYLHTKETLKWFKGDRKKYSDFVREGLDEEIKPEILRQRYIGGEAFAKRIAKRLVYLSEKDRRESEVAETGQSRIQSREEQRAKAIIQNIARFFELSPQMIRNGRRLKGEIGRARSIVVYMLQESLPWTQIQITEYLGLRRKSGITYHLRRVRKDKSLSRVIEKIKKTETGR